ncbi:hypothetical protein LXL04_020427 [Taraxacum kok-saghyz]
MVAHRSSFRLYHITICSCVILENGLSKASFYVTYGNIPYDLDVLFDLYLTTVKHPKRSIMKHVRPFKFRTSWVTKRNYTDYGISL